MNNYNFSTLNDKEFEILVRQLLNAKFDLQLQDFKTGKDKGRDLRYSTRDNNNSIVVQAKHYVRSQYSQLKHSLFKQELDKVKALNPDRYIVTTSLSLSAEEKDILRAGLQPYILNSNDIIGQEDLNSYLSEFPEIEKGNFKLWLSSINIVTAILHNAIEGRSKYFLEKIRDKFPFYVITSLLDDAIKIFKKEKLLLITGQPGIGKTTLAEIIIYQWAILGYKVYYIEDVKDAEDVISMSNDEKQLFYFDDFLGSNYIEIKRNIPDSKMVFFIERIKNTPNKYLILTTRTVILNQAIEISEKLAHSKLKSDQYEIKLSDYSNYEKAQILYNHLYFRDVPFKLSECIFNDRFYRTIIQHKNYTPRIVEFFTDPQRINMVDQNMFRQLILNNLDNPKDIWYHSFKTQINFFDQCFLLTLITFESLINEKLLKIAYDQRLIYERDINNCTIASDQFNDSLKILLNGFVSSSIKDSKEANRIIGFINPSLTDFLLDYIFNSFSERRAIISNIVYIEQLNRFNPDLGILPFDVELQEILRDKIIRNELISIEEKIITNENEHRAQLCEILTNYCTQINIDEILFTLLSQLKYDTFWGNIVEVIKSVLLNLINAPVTFIYIRNNIGRIIESYIIAVWDVEQAKVIPHIFEKYKCNYRSYISIEKNHNLIIKMIKNILCNYEDEFVLELKDACKTIEDIEECYDDIDSMEESLKYILFPNKYIDHDFEVHLDYDYWVTKIEENIKELEMHERYDDDDEYKWERSKKINEDNEIDRLFEL